MSPLLHILPTLLVLFVLSMTVCPTAAARDLWNDEAGDSTLKLTTTLVGMGLVSAPPRHSLPEEREASGSLFGELRFDAIYRINRELQLDMAYDNRLTWRSGTSGGISAALPSTTAGPYRIGQLGGVVGRSRNFLDYNELDRVSLSYQTTKLNVTVGRQSVGWGRGAIFSAVDIFAPFSPLEINRQWRRGVDALRADIKISDTASVDMVTAWGPSWDRSCLGIRLRGFWGPVDAELLFAKRATDYMYGVTSSAAIGDFEAHGEFAAFQTPGDVPYSGLFGNRNWVPKAVLGISNNFTIGSGLKLLLEYHYSGFGAGDPTALPSLLATPAYSTRIGRGDTQILGRQAVALQAAYTFNERWSGSFEVLQSITDPSGVLLPSLSWDISENMTLQAVLFYGYGPSPVAGVPRSQFGSIPATFILKMSFYD
ncbi:MAG: hypothetical protein HXX11_06425 [Desulfuromonadales bacterium]|nr:hypothetical protein [Desulfuromonadales bacterium]